MTDTEDTIILEEQASIAIVRLNRPNLLNALNIPMAEALLATLETIARQPKYRAIVIRGEGRAFCAGGDLSGFQQAQDITDYTDRLIGPFHDAIELIASLEKPSVAMLHGAVAGVGLSLALACDFAVAADSTKFTLAYAKIGASPDGSASWSLPRIVGLRKAKEIALLGDLFDATEAYRLGLVNRCVPPVHLEHEVMALAYRLSAGPTAAYGRIKALLQGSFASTLEEQLDAERAAFKASAATADFAEGLAAFSEKRTPKFNGG